MLSLEYLSVAVFSLDKVWVNLRGVLQENVLGLHLVGLDRIV